MNQENTNQSAGEALSEVQMEAITQAAISANRSNAPIDTTVIDKAKEGFNAGIATEPKAVTSGEEPRLPTLDQLNEIRNIDSTKLELTGSEVLHENVPVPTSGDSNYVPPAPISDTVLPEFGKIDQAVKDMKAQELDKTSTSIEEYDGPGIIIENKQKTKIDPVLAALPPETQGDLGKYLEGMETDMVESTTIRNMMAEVNPNLTHPEDQRVVVDGERQQENGRILRATEAPKEVQVQRAEEAMVVINKMEEGNITFTESEQAKIEEAKVIRVNEVKTIDLKTIKKRRDKKPEVRQAIRKKGNSMRTTQVILPASGFTAEMLGCSPYEIMTLQQDEDPITDNELRWSLIWSKIKSTNIDIKSFSEFYNKVAADDFETLIWGILRSTFEDIDTISLNCTNPDCKKQDGSVFNYDYKYSVASLLRPEFITEDMNANMKRVVSARTMDDVIEAHNSAPINVIESFVLPESGYVVEMSIRSANDFVNKSLASLASENLEPQYRQAAILATSINAILIPVDPDEAVDEYFTYDEAEDITEIIYNLSVNDLLIISHKAADVNNDISFKFGFTDLVCPKCSKHTPFQAMDISTILFYRNALSMSVSVE